MANLDKQTLYEYVVVWHPTEDEHDEKGLRSKIVIPMANMLADTEKAVFMNVVKKLPEEYNDKLDQLDIIIRPF
jgi:hypothetical protein